MNSAPEDSVSVVEEKLRVEKQPVHTATVRVRTETETVEEMASVLLDKQEVAVERIAINREIDSVPEVRTEGDVTIVPVVEEVLVVEKRLLLKEELHIRRQTQREQVDVPVPLRKQRAIVERIDQENGPATEEDKLK